MIEFLQRIKEGLFIVDLLIHYALLVGIVWSATFPQKRIWSPPGKGSWQYRITWILFYLAFILNGLFVFLDWNNWNLPPEARFYIGIPVTLIGALFVIWGVTSLGVENTSGLKNGVKTGGPYPFTRN